MNLKFKALLIAVGIMAFMVGFVYALVFHPGYVAILFGILLVYGLYKLVLSDLEKHERRKGNHK